MDTPWGAHTRKRKRRRGPDRPPISCQFVLDARLKGDVGSLSEDLFSDLFPSWLNQEAGKTASTPQPDICFVAISPVPSPVFQRSHDTASWTVLPVRRSAPSKASGDVNVKSTLRFPISSDALQSFAQNLQRTHGNLQRLAVGNPVDIQILDTVPLALDTIVLRLDEEALGRLEAANQRSRNGPRPQDRSRLQRSSSSFATESLMAEDRWESAVRAALRTQKIVHAGDLLPLPLSSHPITHASPPPAIIEVCEPVAQGIALARTRVVLLPLHEHSKRSINQAQIPRSVLSNGTVHEDEEDTSNEQFFSATEDRFDSPASKAPRRSSSQESHDQPTDEEKSTDEGTDLSDGESDTLGLSLPMLPTHSSGTFSSFSSATPRAGHMMTNGIASPGSMVSGFSMSTVVGGGAKGKLFEARGLLSSVRNETLHPKASLDEDGEARIFVDTAALAKIGCFSGDWVRIEAASDERLDTLGSWGAGTFETPTDDYQLWRAVKVYGLVGLAPRRPRYAINRSGTQRFSQPSSMAKVVPKALMSPMLLVNLGNPSNVRIAGLLPAQNRRSSRIGPPPSRLSHAQAPPVARDVSLRKLSSPLAHERSLDLNIKLALERYFTSCRRIVRSGDLIAIPINESLGRAFSQTSHPEDELMQKELLSRRGLQSSAPTEQSKVAVAWFKIASASAEDQDVDSPWGPIVTIRPEITKISQIGDDHAKVPGVLTSTWPYYFGVRELPPTSSQPSSELEQVDSKRTNYTPLLRRRLRELISAATSSQAIHLSLPPVAILVTSTQRHVGKASLIGDACADVGLHDFQIECYDILSEGGAGGDDVKTAGFLEARAERGLLSGSQYTVLTLRHLETLTADRMMASVRDIISRSRVLVATTTNVDKLPEKMRSLFTHELEMSAPDEGDREGLLRTMCQAVRIPLAADVELSSVALKTAALVAGDLEDVVDRAVTARQERLESLIAATDGPLPATIRDVTVAGGENARCLTKADFDVAVDAARKNFADAIGAPKIPNVSWDDVGGLSNVKDAVMETIQLPLERPELFAKGMKKRSGILFYGPPGTGKTLLAKAIATEFSLNFFSVKGPELLNMYIGESEANVRRVFQRARDARPCVVFFDELDSVAPKRGNQGDSGGVMDRIVSQLLAELDGMSSGEEGGGGGVFVIGATNRPDLLDQALLRPGRFDKMLYLGVSDTHQKQATILEALTRKFALHPTLSLSRVAATLPFTFTGADLYALCSDAMLKAITRRASAVDAKVRAINARQARSAPQDSSHASKPASSRTSSAMSTDSSSSSRQPSSSHALPSIPSTTFPISVAYFFDHLASEEDLEVVVEEEDFDVARRELVPSVSADELRHYERVRRAFEMVDEGKKNQQNNNNHSGSEDPTDRTLASQTSQLRITDMMDGIEHHDDPKDKTKANGLHHTTSNSNNPFRPGKDKGKGKAKAMMTSSEEESWNYRREFGFGNAVDDSEESELYGP
ncbi:MAG: peroxisomal assembly protein [Chrysothrix sp. TS-e1954]|nr:MAG: peroxisomal assembly protein [Chrysothrix sp. TS-e1954]